MRGTLGTALLAAMLCASPLAHAQRASLGDRIAALEARAAGDQGATELVNQIGMLRTEVQELRGEIEQLQQQLEQARAAQRTQYLDIDGRLTRLEGGIPAQAGATGGTPAPASASPAVIPPPAPVGVAAADERGAYAHAFDALKSGDYVESARRFRDFLAAYPAGPLAANGLYWLGESYYVTQNYALAGEQFRALLQRHPTHDKAPGALLKLGLSQVGLRDFDAAEATLRDVIARHPGTDVARTADDRLRALALARSQ